MPGGRLGLPALVNQTPPPSADLGAASREGHLQGSDLPSSPLGEPPCSCVTVSAAARKHRTPGGLHGRADSRPVLGPGSGRSGCRRAGSSRALSWAGTRPSSRCALPRPSLCDCVLTCSSYQTPVRLDPGHLRPRLTFTTPLKTCLQIQTLRDPGGEAFHA